MSYLDWVKYVNSTAGGIQQFAKSNLKKLGAKSSILELKQDIDTAIIENKLRIFVFIDDLDRLTPNEVIEVFQIIKLNASFKNTVFVIAYDKEVVQDILALHHGFNGEKYIEKIVQVDYRIPDPLDEVLQADLVLRAAMLTSVPAAAIEDLEAVLASANVDGQRVAKQAIGGRPGLQQFARKEYRPGLGSYKVGKE